MASSNKTVTNLCTKAYRKPNKVKGKIRGNFKNKTKYLKDTMNFTDLERGRNKLKDYYPTSNNIINNENDNLTADTHTTLNR